MKLFKKKHLTQEQELKKLKKDNIRYQIDIIIIFALLLALFFFNYNYTIFKILIAGNYVDTNTLDSIYKEELDVEKDSNYYKNFDNVVIQLFMDKLHLTNNDEFTMLFNMGGLEAEHDAMDEDSSKSSFKKINDSTGLLTLTTFSQPAVKIFKENLDELNSCDTLVIDLRENTGGILNTANKLAEYFLPSGSTIAQYNYRSKTMSSAPVSKNKSPLSYSHIYILQDDYTASAAEVFENALKENLDNVTTVGINSYGKGIGQTEMKLLSGFGIKATTLNILTPKGNSINHTGIKPDIECKTDALDYVKKNCIKAK